MRWLIFAVLAVTLAGCGGETTDPSVSDPSLPVAAAPSKEPSTAGSRMPGNERSTPQSGEPLTAEQREANRVFQQGNAALETGNYAKAEQFYLQSLDLFKQARGEQHPNYAANLTCLALLYHMQADLARAEPIYRQAVEIERQVRGEQHSEYADSLFGLATLYSEQGSYARAEPLYRQALEIRKQALGEQHPGYAGSLHSLAILYLKQGDYARAEPLLRQAVEIRKQVLGAQHPDYANSLNILAALYKQQGDYARAEPLHRQAVEILKQAHGEQHPHYAASLANLANLYREQGDYARAEPLFQQALEIRKQVRGAQHPDYATSLHSLAILYLKQGDYARAEPLLRQAVEIRKQVLGAQHPDYATSLNNLAILYLKQGDYARAEPLYRQAVEIRKQVLAAQHPGYASSLHGLAILYLKQGDYARAEPLFRQAVEILKQAHGEQHPDYATSLGNLANLYSEQGDYARAEPLHRQAVEILKQAHGEQHPGYAGSLANLANLYREQGDYARAERLFRQALEIRKQVLGTQHPDYANSFHGLVLLRADLDQPAEGLQLMHQFTEIMWRLLDRTAAVQSDRQQLAMAQAHSIYIGNLLGLARLSAAAPVEFYPAVFRWKGQVLLRQQAARQLRAAAAADTGRPVERTFHALAGKSQQLSRLAELAPPPAQREAHRRQLAEVTRELEDLQQELSRLSVEYRQSQDQVSRTPDDVAASLPPLAALIDFREYWQYKPQQTNQDQRWELQYVAFIVRREQPVQVVWLGAAKPVNAAVTAWREQLATDLSAEAGQTLRKLVWEPLEPHLDGITTVLVSPDGGLNQLPWGALPGHQPDTYLLVERSFVTIPVPLLLPDLLQRQDAPAGDLSLIALGGVDYDASPTSSESPPVPVIASLTVPANLQRGAAETLNRQAGGNRWPPLPGTALEQQAIATLHTQYFPQGTRHTLSGAGAGENQLRRFLATAGIVHLATHGYFAPEKFQAMGQAASGRADRLLHERRTADLGGFVPGLLSGVVLAGANHPGKESTEDGVLTASEVETLSLKQTELLVLSACETGLGKAAGGEGVLGLQRAFQLAGARSVVASLWKVDDNATQALMSEFYRNLWEKKLGKLEALRQAQLTMIKGYDSQTGAVRGLGKNPVPLVSSKEKPKQLPPFYWAAFQLSGDWR